ncbi:hypothetical protein ACH4TV_11365 [Streptomyces sp. NPDC020898]|uniref:hypothetical protein n=1 Tax=Streptomyces sp. NPDC020898 TaxID=3365101 RepID=UPI003799ADF9
MNDFLLTPLVVAVGIVGFLIATGAVSTPAVIGAAVMILFGACSQARRNSHPRHTPSKKRRQHP